MFKLFLPAALFLLSSCAVYVNEAKYERKISMEELREASDEGSAFLASLMDFDSLTENKIVKFFGEPERVEEKDGKTVLHYTFQGKIPQSEIWFILPVKYKSGDGIYKYSFSFEGGRLKEIACDELKKKSRGIIVLPPVLINGNAVLDLNPFETKQCREEFSEIQGMFPNMNTGNAVFKKSCLSNRLFGLGIIRSSAFEKSRWPEGYSKVTSSKVFIYDKDVFPALRKEITGYYRKTAETADADRYEEAVLTEKSYKTDDLNCRIFLKTGKDFKAPNKGSHSYLILDNAGALCFTKHPEMIVDIQNSNRYPQTMKAEVDTYRELTDILDTVKIGKLKKQPQPDKKKQ